MQVQIARVKSERAEAARKASYHYQQQLLHEEQWIQLDCFGLQVITMTTFSSIIYSFIVSHNVMCYKSKHSLREPYAYHST